MFLDCSSPLINQPAGANKVNELNDNMNQTITDSLSTTRERESFENLIGLTATQKKAKKVLINRVYKSEHFIF